MKDYMDFTPSITLGEIRGSGMREGDPQHIRNLPGTPPVDLFGTRQVSRLAASVLAFPKPAWPSDSIKRMLAAYSCGGSFGIADLYDPLTEFPP